MTEVATVASAGPEVLAVDAENVPHLVGSSCSECGLIFFPGDLVCPVCLAQSPPSVRLSNQGKLYSFSIVHIAPARWDPPYAIGYVDLPEGVRIFTHLAADDLSLLRPDMTVELDVSQLAAASGELASAYRFVPSAPVDGS